MTDPVLATPARPKSPSTVAQHRATPEVSLQAHVRSRQLAFGRSLAQRKSIYLDLRFWIHLRDAVRFGRTGPAADLLAALRSLAANELAFCPISRSTLLELFKQDDAGSRAATARLIDELSAGATFIPLEERILSEMEQYLDAAPEPERRHPLRTRIWSRLGYVMGEVHPVPHAFDPPTQLVIQKAFFDHLWDNATMQQLCDMLGDGFVKKDPLGHGGTVQRMKEQIAAHAAEIDSYRTAYRHELVGVADLFVPAFMEILERALPADAHPWPAPGTPGHAQLQAACLQLLVAGFDTERGKDVMRTLHIKTSLHAAVRWNKTQLMKQNDLFDFRHACAAVGYCDAFFTDGPLRALLTRADLGLIKRYGCFVSDDVDASLRFVEGLM